MYYIDRKIRLLLPENAEKHIQTQMIKYINLVREIKNENALVFKQAVGHGQIVVLEKTSHYCFIDNERIVVQKMKDF